MRIFFVVNTLELKFACDLMRELSHRHTVAVATVLGIGSDYEKHSLDTHGVTIFNLNGPRNKIRFLFEMPTLIQRLRSYMREFKPEVVHTHFWLSDILAAKAVTALGVRKIISTQHDLVPLPWLIAKAKRRALANMHAVVAISKSVALFLETRFCVPKQKICIVYNGISISAFEKGKKSDAQWLPTIGLIARLERIKGTDLFLQSLVELKDRPVLVPKVIIVGDGSERSSLETFVTTNHLPVEFTGMQTDLIPTLKEIDVIVVPSRSEGLSVTILESLASGKLVIASNVGGVPEVIQDKENGLLVTPDARSLADALQWVLEHRAEALALRQRGNTWLKDRRETFDIMNTAKHYELLYS